MLINQSKYDGSLIHQSGFCYKYFKDKVLPTGNIILFRAPMEVTLNLIDLEDSLNQDYIYSEDAINLCWEIPNLDPLGAVFFQRLFNTQLAQVLYKLIQKPIAVDGDDLIVFDLEMPKTNKFVEGGRGKCSVSIAYSKNNVAIGHTGINIIAGPKAPDFAYSTKLTNEQLQTFCNDAMMTFYTITHDSFVACTKICV